MKTHKSVTLKHMETMNMGQKSILIIDDDSRNIFALAAVLKSRGYPVSSATNMEDAFNLLNADKEIGIVLIDMMMPEMDGYEAIPMLKNNGRYKNIPIIAVTAQAMSGDRERCLAAGADEYVAKPVDVDKLLTILKPYTWNQTT